jgi:hypothetical protein
MSFSSHCIHVLSNAVHITNALGVIVPAVNAPTNMNPDQQIAYEKILM